MRAVTILVLVCFALAHPAATAGGSVAYNPVLRDAIIKAANKYKVPAEVLIATTLVESGGRLDAVGDSGRSHGPFQEYDLGRGAGLSTQQRRDPVGAAMRAAKEFAAFKSRGFSGAELAYRAQRPADHAGYVSKVNSYMDQARQILGGGSLRGSVGSTGTQGVPGDVGSPPAAGGGQDGGMESMIQGFMEARQGRRQGQGSRFRALAMSALNDMGSAAAMEAEKMVGGQGGNQIENVNNERNMAGAAANAGAPGGQGAAAHAVAQIGLPYSWGGGSTSGPGRGTGRGASTVGFDCSSLVQYAWAKKGVSIPRVTYDQIKVGTRVANASQARPGDLFFPHSGHVMMYVGGGKLVHAPQTGKNIQYANVSDRSYIMIRRPG